ncbi:MAG TPA: hypothetical protein ENK79_01485, partial [Campylobacterales bacterium]|nr:hypothetical protein [Campylobacterales bacterium]
MLKRLIPILITSIIYANPTQIVALNEPFEIENNSSVFNTDLSYTYNEILKCNPKLDVVYKIESIHKLKIIPKKPLKSGTDYQCKYDGNKIIF